MRKTGVFQYYASLPISKGALLTAILTVRVLTALPGLALTLVVGAWLYDVTLAVNAATLLLLPLTVVALSGIGAALGILVSDFRVVAAVSQLVFVVIMFASPVLIPPESLPPVPPLALMGAAADIRGRWLPSCAHIGDRYKAVHRPGSACLLRDRLACRRFEGASLASELRARLTGVLFRHRPIGDLGPAF